MFYFLTFVRNLSEICIIVHEIPWNTFKPDLVIIISNPQIARSVIA